MKFYDCTTARSPRRVRIFHRTRAKGARSKKKSAQQMRAPDRTTIPIKQSQVARPLNENTRWLVRVMQMQRTIPQPFCDRVNTLLNFG